MDEMRENMRRANPIEDLVHRTDSPFMTSINGHPLPPKFKMPSLDSYDGTHDLFDHIATFKTMMHLQGSRMRLCAEPSLPLSMDWHGYGLAKYPRIQWILLKN